MNKEEINEILQALMVNPIISADKIPDIQLYMDQVTTFAEDNLSPLKRNEEDKLLTKTMINNYAKFNLIKPPIKKKYDKDSIINLILIYHLKNIISINDIKTILNNVDEGENQQLYEIFTEMQKNNEESFKEEFTEDFLKLIPQDLDEKKAQIFMALMLINQANLRKQVAERLIDKFLTEEKTGDEKNGKKKAVK